MNTSFTKWAKVALFWVVVALAVHLSARFMYALSFEVWDMYDRSRWDYFWDGFNDARMAVKIQFQYTAAFIGGMLAIVFSVVFDFARWCFGLSKSTDEEFVPCVDRVCTCRNHGPDEFVENSWRLAYCPNNNCTCVEHQPDGPPFFWSLNKG